MPHVIIEFSPRLEEQIHKTGLMEKVHNKLIDSALFSVSAIKTRLRKTDLYIIGDKAPGIDDYIYVEVAILDGRPSQKKQELSGKIHQLLLEEFPQVFSLSCEIRDIDKETYFKN